VFLDRPEFTPDTSGSAGIAAALAIGAQQGWLDATAKSAAARTLTGLKPHLTADGMLGGVSQANKSNDDLQRGICRLVYQMGMGLMVQLIAALEQE
jgi:unsaturated rhamnogalacturonyl hydrolase